MRSDDMKATGDCASTPPSASLTSSLGEVHDEELGQAAASAASSRSLFFSEATPPHTTGSTRSPRSLRSSTFSTVLMPDDNARVHRNPKDTFAKTIKDTEVVVESIRRLEQKLCEAEMSLKQTQSTAITTSPSLSSTNESQSFTEQDAQPALNNDGSNLSNGDKKKPSLMARMFARCKSACSCCRR